MQRCPYFGGVVCICTNRCVYWNIDAGVAIRCAYLWREVVAEAGEGLL